MEPRMMTRMGRERVRQRGEEWCYTNILHSGEAE